MIVSEAFNSSMNPIERRRVLAITCGFVAFARSRYASAASGTGEGEPKRFSIVVPAALDSPTSSGVSWGNIAQGIASDLIASGRFEDVESDLSHPDEASLKAPPPFEQ